MKPITDILREARNGFIVDKATDQMAELVKRVDLTRKSGSITITIKVSPDKHSSSQKTLDFGIKCSMPEEDLPQALFFSTPEGDLLRDDPEQRRLPFEAVNTARQAGE